MWTLFKQNRECRKNILEKWQWKNLCKGKSNNYDNCNNQCDCKFYDKSKQLIKPGFSFAYRTENFIHCTDDRIKKFSCHPDNPHSKKNIKWVYWVQLHKAVQNRNDVYDVLNLCCKADYKIIDVWINLYDSNQNCKDNQCDWNKRKDKTKRTGWSTFPQSIFSKVRNCQI